MSDIQLGISEVSARNKAVVGHELADLFDGRVFARQDQVRRFYGIGRQLDTHFPCPDEQGAQSGAKGGLIAALDRLLQVGVELLSSSTAASSSFSWPSPMILMIT